MKALVIAPQPFFSPRGTPFSVYYRTLVSSELGANIDFLTYGQGEDVNIPNVRFYRTPAFSFLGRIKIGPSALKLFHDIFIFFTMIWLLLRKRYDVVHAHEEAVFLALLLKPFFRFKMVYDMHSSLPQQLTNFNYTSQKFAIDIFTLLENKSLAASDAVITICPDLFSYVNKVLPDNDKNFLIENSIFEPVNLKEERREKNKPPETLTAIPEKFKKILVYAGTLEDYQGIDILLDAISLINQQQRDIGVIIVGGSSEQVSKYIHIAKELGISQNVIFLGQQPQAIAKAYNQAADILISPRKSGTNTPLKIYEQLASGKPLVATNIYSHTQILTNEVAFLVEPRAEGLAEGILAATAPGAIKKADNARKLYDREYAKPAYVNKLRLVFKKVAPDFIPPENV